MSITQLEALEAEAAADRGILFTRTESGRYYASTREVADAALGVVAAELIAAYGDYDEDSGNLELPVGDDRWIVPARMVAAASANAARVLEDNLGIISSR